MRRFLIAAVIPVGLIAGYFGMANLNTPTPRPLAALNLFKRFCVPLAQGRTIPIPPQFEDISSLPNETRWAESKSAIELTRHSNGCSVSDQLLHFTPTERAAFQTKAAAMVQAAFPALELDVNHSVGSWDHFTSWAQYPKNDPRHWAVLLVRFSSVGDDATTSLSLALPRK